MQRKTLAFRYLLSEEIGEGAVATVWRAFDLVEDCSVAVKLLKDVLDPEDAARLQMEVSVVARLDHPNIIKFLDQGVTTQGQRYVVMELLTGETLRERLVERDVLKGDHFLSLFEGVFAALKEAHGHKVVHRDVKPENVMLLYPKDAVKLLDFGMAKVMGGSVRSVTMSGHLFGTPHYMAPERIKGASVRAPADIYSAGVMMYEVLMGHRPFGGQTSEEIMRKHLRATPPQMTEDIPQTLVDLTLDCLQKDPPDRPDAKEVFATLKSVEKTVWG